MWRVELKELAQFIRAHPRFPQASRRFVNEYVAYREQIRVLNKVISNLGRERILEHLVYLHYARTPSQPGSGATFERLAGLSNSRDGIGERSVRTGLRLAQVTGLVALTRSRADARLRIYEPTEPLIEMIRRYSELSFAIADELAPKLHLSARVRQEPGLTTMMLARMGAIHLHEDFSHHRETDPLANLLRLEGGRAILSAVVDCHWRALPLPPPTEFARKFFVSPSQIRAILKSAEAQGLIRVGARGALLDADPLARAYDSAQCRYLAYALHCGLGLDRSALA